MDRRQPATRHLDRFKRRRIDLAEIKGTALAVGRIPDLDAVQQHQREIRFASADGQVGTPPLPTLLKRPHPRQPVERLEHSNGLQRLNRVAGHYRNAARTGLAAGPCRGHNNRFGFRCTGERQEDSGKLALHLIIRLGHSRRLWGERNRPRSIAEARG